MEMKLKWWSWQIKGHGGFCQQPTHFRLATPLPPFCLLSKWSVFETGRSSARLGNGGRFFPLLSVLGSLLAFGQEGSEAVWGRGLCHQQLPFRNICNLYLYLHLYLYLIVFVFAFARICVCKMKKCKLLLYLCYLYLLQNIFWVWQQVFESHPLCGIVQDREIPGIETDK